MEDSQIAFVDSTYASSSMKMPVHAPVGIETAMKIVSYQAGRCKYGAARGLGGDDDDDHDHNMKPCEGSGACGCKDFCASEMELFICRECGHHISDHEKIQEPQTEVIEPEYWPLKRAGLKSTPEAETQDNGELERSIEDFKKSRKAQKKNDAKAKLEEEARERRRTAAERLEDLNGMVDDARETAVSLSDPSCYSRYHRGRLVYTDGCVYEGEFIGSSGVLLRHGRGVLKKPDGEVYIGEFENDLKSGPGRLHHATGEVYEGMWKDDVITGPGRGTLRMGSADKNDDSFSYCGAFFNGLRHGHGVLTSKKGDCYVGMWRNDCFEGKGTYVTSDGDHYKGFWCKGKMEGFGEMRWSNGTTYRGSWLDGQMHGEGTLTNEHGVYRGEFRMGRKTGNAVVENPAGDKYVGRVENGSIESTFGIIQAYDGEKFQTRPESLLRAANERHFAIAEAKRSDIVSKYAIRQII
eukprot:g204.t1